jgi:hypothetical protein
MMNNEISLANISAASIQLVTCVTSILDGREDGPRRTQQSK